MLLPNAAPVTLLQKMGIEPATGTEVTVVSDSGGYGVYMEENRTSSLSLCYLVGSIWGGWWWLAPSHLALSDREGYKCGAVVFGSNDDWECRMNKY